MTKNRPVRRRKRNIRKGHLIHPVQSHELRRGGLRNRRNDQGQGQRTEKGNRKRKRGGHIRDPVPGQGKGNQGRGQIVVNLQTVREIKVNEVEGRDQGNEQGRKRDRGQGKEKDQRIAEGQGQDRDQEIEKGRDQGQDQEIEDRDRGQKIGGNGGGRDRAIGNDQGQGLEIGRGRDLEIERGQGPGQETERKKAKDRITVIDIISRASFLGAK